MKNTKTIIISIAIATIISSCSKDKKQAENNNTTIDSTVVSSTESNSTEVSTSASFDINKIPVSDKEIGDFPFFSLPDGLKEQNKPIQRKYDMLFFPIDGKMTKLEGQIWKSFIESKDGYDNWSLPYFLKSYDEAILAAGGVKVYDGKVPRENLDSIEKEAQYFGEEGSIDYWNEPVKTYIIRLNNGGDVYIQISGNTAGGVIQILQKETFKQTIKPIQSKEIKKDLDKSGKSVLHINFDTDKAILKPDGKDAVAEITKVLKEDTSLKLAINGYTDNTGDANHNLQLSKQRAETVKNELIKSGIEANRLSSDGFGANNPIADNNTEDGKSQNRRVELVKK